MKTDIKIFSEDVSGNSSSKTITYVNPSITGSQAYNLAMHFNSLTSNEFVGANRIDTTALEATGGGDS